MLGKAHITIGIASALSFMMPENIPAALPVIAGSAAGCLICDIDCDSPRERSDASRHRALGAVIACLALLADYQLGVGSRQAAADHGIVMVCAGIAGLVLTVTFASISAHRGFSHSLLALMLEAGCLQLIYPQTVLPFVIAFASHLALDLTNKRPVRLLYPLKKGYCLGLYYADRLANKVCAALGTLWLAAAILHLALS